MTFAEILRPYQVDAVDFAASRPGAALFCEQGTGKTFIAAGLIERLAASSATSAHLVIVPLANVQTTWERALARLAGVSTLRSWESFRRSSDAHRVLLLHYEAFRAKRLVAKAVRFSWTSVTYDESQRIKRRGSKASRAAARFRDVTHRVALSGTPIEQAPQDLWAQLRFVDVAVLGRSWEDFAQRWLKPCGFMGYDWEFRQKLMPQFLAAIDRVVFRVTKSEVLDLPPIVHVRERVPLLGDQRRVYREIERDGVSVLPDGRTLVCDMAITELIRLQQIAGGFVTLGKDVVAIGHAKRRRLGVVIRREHRRHGPLVIFCNFTEEVKTCVETATAVLPDARVGVISGKTRKTRPQMVDAMQGGDLDVLVCQIRAGGVAIDLFRSCVGIFYSQPHSSIDFDQGISRLHRGGQTRVTRIITLEAVKTVDEIIVEALRMKRSVSQQVLDDHRQKKKRTHMAKPDPKKPDPKPATTAADKPAEKTKPTPPPPALKPKYGVPELAEAMNVKAASLRVKLRQAKIAKNGKVYGWETKVAMQEVIDKLKASQAKSGAKKAAAVEEDEETDGD